MICYTWISLLRDITQSTGTAYGVYFWAVGCLVEARAQILILVWHNVFITIGLVSISFIFGNCRSTSLMYGVPREMVSSTRLKTRTSRVWYLYSPQCYKSGESLRGSIGVFEVWLDVSRQSNCAVRIWCTDCSDMGTGPTDVLFYLDARQSCSCKRIHFRLLGRTIFNCLQQGWIYIQGYLYHQSRCIKRGQSAPIIQVPVEGFSLLSTSHIPATLIASQITAPEDPHLQSRQAYALPFGRVLFEGPTKSCTWNSVDNAF